MPTNLLHDSRFLKILWDAGTRIIGIEWKESTAAMTDEDFKAVLETFAGHVEAQRARGILVDVARFQHTMGPGVEEWRVKNISNRYSAAGIQRFAFLFPEGASIPPTMNQSAPGEGFATRAFHSAEEATLWLSSRA
jgi:hypothetical protein